MAAPVLTSRQLQNVRTSLDMWVPEYQEIRGRMMTGHVEYQIVVVTTLPAFKSAKHKPEDVVQFVVSKKYSEIEEIYQKLSTLYPRCLLPPFPRKVLFVGETDIRDRRAAFNDIVKAIARERDLASCRELQDFLVSSIGDFVESSYVRPHVKASEDDDFFKDEAPLDGPLLHVASTLQNKNIVVQEEEDEEEEVDFDPLGIMKTKRVKKKVATRIMEDAKVMPRPTMGLFTDEVDPDADLFEPNGRTSSINKKTLMAVDDIKLFEEQDLGGTVKLGDSLIMPSACSNDPLFRPSSPEDTDDLFRVEEDLEKLLNLGVKSKNKPTKPKPKIPMKPTFLKETKKSSSPSHTDSKRTEPSIQAMDESDILNYIKENESADSDSLSLF
ncbi:HCLS1-binding protein 3 [Mixophyes fleayi]|uniref:HCLS1-binding protein 3 n=1 Tax=Mixophyes fleayi TaxID=3061075 RepID=UPI003F4D9E66